MKTSELTGAALDWAVARCEEGEALAAGWHPHIITTVHGDKYLRATPYAPSTDWSQGGPIIDREKIATAWHITRWVAWRGVREHPGPTPLVAAMRCRIASELGDEVDVPEELL